MSNNYFPHDIIIDILLNLPVKSLGNFKLVCKSWRSVIEDDQFIKQHRDQCQRDINCHKILLASWKWYYYCNCYSIDAPQLQHERDSDNVSLLELPVLPQLDPEINLTLEGVHADDCVFVNSCDGLFLLRFSSDIIVLWNPAIKESRIIPPPISIEEEDSNPSYGLGHVSDYKIVRVVRTKTDGYYVQIFSTKMDLWKLIGKLPRCDYFDGKMVVDDDGFVYMITYECANKKSVIQCMSMKNENFEDILFPDAWVKNPVLFIAGKNLLLMNETIDSRVLYCMEKNGMRSSWSKILAITKLDDPLNAIYWIDTVAFSKDRDLLLIMLNETFAFQVYDSKRRKFEKARVKVLEQVKDDVLESSQPYFGQEYVALAYVETLISPNAL
ncbi:hypothetical protein K7X08_023650 [Anisodus acutangulus]|uniref:F-box domain-containing protein n=1 Tax=Anisodus acutangulus TaxID=402998 RepID=A0A9Q1QWT1_9SOLA|nr:hypothetical protein K7X08_023650 [Anisodus acutangulus]